MVSKGVEKAEYSQRVGPLLSFSPYILNVKSIYFKFN